MRRQTRSKRQAGQWLLIAGLLIAGCESVSRVSGDETRAEPDAEAAVVDELAAAYRRSNRREGILFWSEEQRRIGFRNIDRIFPTRTVHAGVNTYEFGTRLRDFSNVTYEVEGERFTFEDFVAKEENRGLLIVKDGDILFERYADGHDENTVWISFSVSKSITSMLIGAAVQDGYIESVDEPVAHYLPRLRGTPYEKATIRNVLQMASGVAWNEDYGDPDSDVARAGGANGMNLVTYLAGLSQEEKPGEQFNYNTGETNLVGEILRSAIGNNASTYLEHKIWKPFGMADDSNWTLGAEGGGELGGCCVSATLRDYARLGVFAMNDGVLPDGTRVLPEGWMEKSTTPSKGAPFYGYLWWLVGDGSYSARGIFGQIIFVDPANDMVIALHSNAPTASGSSYIDHANALIGAIRREVGRY